MRLEETYEEAKLRLPFPETLLARRLKCAGRDDDYDIYLNINSIIGSPVSAR